MRGVLKRFAAILFGLLLLLICEGGLRLVWTPPPLPDEQLVAVTIDPFEVRQGRAQVRDAYLGGMRPASLAVPKPEQTFRIFCVGGSTTMGYPYAAEVAWPASLERRLVRLFPERSIEVVNLGAASYGSGRTLALLRGILRYQPDLVVVATGDAEFVEDSFRVAISQPGPPISGLHRLYLSRALKSMLPEPPPRTPTVDAEDRSAAGFLFAPVVSGTVYRVDSSRRAAVMAAFADNLREISAVARQAGVPLIFATLPANLASWPPDPEAGQPPDPAVRSEWQRHVDAAKQGASAGQTQVALEHYAAATALWDGNASVCFDYGQLLMASGQFDLGRRLLVRAADRDPTPVRATTEVNETIRSVAARDQVTLADSAQAFAASSPHGLPGEDLILDYAHPTPRGHAEFARVVLHAVLARNPSWPLDQTAERTTHQAELDRLSHSAAEVANVDLSFALGQVFERKGLVAQAEEMYRQTIARGYRGPFPAFNLARLLALQERHAEALAILAPLPEQYPDWQEPYALLGYLYQQSGDDRAALSWYRRALDAGDPDPRLYASLAGLQLDTGSPAAARQTLEEGVGRNPGNCELAAMLGQVLEQQAAAAAEDFYRQKLEARPYCHELAESLGLLLMSQRRWTEARDLFLDALRQPASWPQHHLNLGYVFWEGLHDEQAAREEFGRFLGLQPGQVGLVPEAFRGAATAGDARP